MKKNSQSKRTSFVIVWTLVFAVLIAFLSFLQIQPKNTRDWVSDFSVLPTVEINGDLVTINNIRDWSHTEAQTISQEYINRTFNVTDLERVWFLIEPFGKWEGVAHTYFVFDFKNQMPVAFSIEARREKGEEYSAFLGLFKKYELIYMWGTEQDFTLKRVIQLKNDVHMYPMTVSPEFQKNLFIELAKATQELETQPRFYNTLTSNCTNNLAYHANNIKPGAAPFHYARFLTGYSGSYVHGLGYIPHGKPFEEIKNQYYINDIVKDIYQEENFSQLLREKLLQ